MFKKQLFIALITMLCSTGLFADQANLVFVAAKNKNDKDVTRLLQDLALTRNYSQLDKIREKHPELFEAKYLPGEFINKIIFTYVESAAAKAKDAQKTSGNTNPHAKNSWQWLVWDLESALATRAASKDVVLKKTLTDRINRNIDALNKTLKGYLDTEERLTITLYLFALSTGSYGVEGEIETVERLNAKFAAEANELLKYLFKAGVPFSTELPTALKIGEWKRLETAYKIFVDITHPDKKSEFETTAEYEARVESSRLLQQAIRSIELTLPAKLQLGEYNAEKGYFNLSVSVPDLPPIIVLHETNKMEIRFYIDRKNAAFFKEKGFSELNFTTVLFARAPGIYNFKEIQAKKGNDSVIEGLYAFSIRKVRGIDNETLVSINSYSNGISYDFSGTKVAGYETVIRIPVDGRYSLRTSGESPILLWESDLSAIMGFGIGEPGMAGGYIFYDKGKSTNGWRYLECSEEDIGRMNYDDALIACQKYKRGGFTNWALPGADLMNLMYQNLFMNGLGSFTGDYWSSSKDLDGYPLLFSFWGPNQSRGMSRDTMLNVRPIRGF